MTAKYFVDSNVLAYSASNASAEQTKRRLAIDLLQRPDLALSGQVLAEFYVVATARTKLNLTHDEAVFLLTSLAHIPTCPITRELVLRAVELRKQYGISYWDAAIIAAAKAMECTTVYSEDLNDGQSYDGVTVVNPFAAVRP